MGRETDKQHYMCFYGADWLGDEALALCSGESVGVWAGIMAYVGCRSPQRGRLVTRAGLPPKSSAEIAALIRRPVAEVDRALVELEREHVFSRDVDGVIYSRRVVRDAELSEIRKAAGEVGGKQKASKQPSKIEANAEQKAKQTSSKVASKPLVFGSGSGSGSDPDLSEGVQGEPESAPPASGADAESVAELWNQIARDSDDRLPSVQKLTEKRRTKIRARIAEAPERREVAWWRAYFDRIASTPFCCGESDRGWTASLDWAVSSEDVVAKVLEGTYRGRPSAAPVREHVADRAVREAREALAAEARAPPGETFAEIEDDDGPLFAQLRAPERADGYSARGGGSA